MRHLMNTSRIGLATANQKVLLLSAYILTGLFGVANAEIAQEPLFLGGGGIPGNMVLVPSVEWPTVLSVANIDDEYEAAKVFVGYFDSNKCYVYRYSATASERHFKPNSITSTRKCSGAGEWSGNFLNWAATQTIDPFRKALTGGLRVKDTETQTWLEKARHTGQGGNGIYPIRDLNDSTEVSGATPFTANRIRVRIADLGSDLRFSLNDNDYDLNPVNFDPNVHIDPAGVDRGYRMSVRLSVCEDPTVTGLPVEENCRQYPSGNWKPEGLLQQNAESIRFSVFGFLNEDGQNRDGGVLRAAQKYIGPRKLVPGDGFVDNDQKEWDPQTGIFVQNPNPSDATASSVTNSGVINYLNKFGQLTNNNLKSQDPVSELYYAATRYLKNQGNVAAYTDMTGASAAEMIRWKDGFPVITDWKDPIEFTCQVNVLLGIGDTNTHRDKNLPGNTAWRSDEPDMPAEVSADNTVDVVTATNRVGQLEGIGNIGNSDSFSGRENSAYIAGLAWDNHVNDMRPDIPGVQTASTHWVDVLENRVLQGTTRNQYYLATKYGGFTKPDDFNPATITELENSWWSSGKTETVGSRTMEMPKNFYLAGQAGAMVDSLRLAFSNITEELQSSAAAVAANSTRLDTDTAVFQGSFNSKRWSGELAAFKVNADGSIEATPAWSAGKTLDNRNYQTRNIVTVGSLATEDGRLIANNGKVFSWKQIETDVQQREALRSQLGGGLVPDTVAEQRVNYLRGERLYEQNNDNLSLPFRQRDSVLGDIVNSNPQFAYKSNFGYDKLPAALGGSSYTAFRTVDKAGTTPIVLVGSNSGMLHAFNADINDADAGKELFAYVPAGVYENLFRLTLPGYAHRYYVDGTPRVADVWTGTVWKTIAVGTTGAGGKSVFALDVTRPEAFGTTDVMWEFSHEKMGYTIQQPAVVALNNNKFGVVVTSGYHDSPTGKSYVWILDVNDGQILKEFELESAELGSPLVVDLKSNAIADRIYVAGNDGKLWRIDIDDSDSSKWAIPSSLKAGGNFLPLFTEPNARPITAQLTSAFNEKGEHMVFFGTGSFLRTGDNIVPSSPGMDYFYGIIDSGTAINTRDNLLKQEITHEGKFESTNTPYRVVTDEKINANHKGWYIPLVLKTNTKGAGERVVARALVRGDRLIFTTVIPATDPCAFGGDSWLMEVNMANGGRLNYSVFDMNEDGKFNSEDIVNIGTEDDPIWVTVSGLSSGIGLINTPAVITGVDPNKTGSDDEIKVISGSSGQIISISEAGSSTRGRQGWEQLR